MSKQSIETLVQTHFPKFEVGMGRRGVTRFLEDFGKCLGFGIQGPAILAQTVAQGELTRQD